MSDKDRKPYEIAELDDSALEDASGGDGLDVSCPENTNCAGANCVAGCGGGGGGTEVT